MRGPGVREQGAALLVMLALLIVAAGYLLISRLNATDMQHAKQFDTQHALADAKAALLGQAIGSATRPGELPCPDRTGDGLVDPCTGSGPAHIGRLPVLTLQLDDGHDETGETFWYAVDRAFDATGGAINSDTPATLALDGQSVVALIFAAGGPVGTQTRPFGATNNAANYLEDDNADGDADFVSHAAGDFNDRVIAITREELMQAVERRVLGETAHALSDYFDATKGGHRFLPYADVTYDGKCDSLMLQGWFPLRLTDCGLPDWYQPLPAWVAANGWNHLLWYALSDYCQPGTTNCADTGGGHYLTLDGVTGKHALLLTTGTALASQIRPLLPLPPLAGFLGSFLDTIENQNLDTVFASHPLDATSNDQILEVPTP